MGGIEKSGDTATATVALVGVHVVGVVQDHPEFIWGTFEQVENAPDLPPLVPPTSDTPVSPQNFTFYKAGTTAAQSNQQAPLFTVDQASQAIAPVTNVFRQFAFGNATPDRVADIDSTNKLFRQMIGGGSVKKIDQVFSNYNLIGSLWLLPNTLEPNYDKLQPTASARSTSRTRCSRPMRRAPARAASAAIRPAVGTNTPARTSTSATPCWAGCSGRTRCAGGRAERQRRPG